MGDRMTYVIKCGSFYYDGELDPVSGQKRAYRYRSIMGVVAAFMRLSDPAARIVRLVPNVTGPWVIKRGDRYIEDWYFTSNGAEYSVTEFQNAAYQFDTRAFALANMTEGDRIVRLVSKGGS